MINLELFNKDETIVMIYNILNQKERGTLLEVRPKIYKGVKVFMFSVLHYNLYMCLF